jgi:hypothetical protein
MHSGCFDLHRADAQQHGAFLRAAVTHHQGTPLFVTLVLQFRYVLISFCLQGEGQHPPRSFAGQLIQRQADFWFCLSCRFCGKLHLGVSFPGCQPAMGCLYPKDTPPFSNPQLLIISPA